MIHFERDGPKIILPESRRRLARVFKKFVLSEIGDLTTPYKDLMEAVSLPETLQVVRWVYPKGYDYGELVVSGTMLLIHRGLVESDEVGEIDKMVTRRETKAQLGEIFPMFRIVNDIREMRGNISQNQAGYTHLG